MLCYNLIKDPRKGSDVMAQMIIIALALITAIVVCIKRKIYALAILFILMLLGLLYVAVNLGVFVYQAQIHAGEA